MRRRNPGIPRTILGMPRGLVLGGLLAAAGYMAFTRGGGAVSLPPSMGGRRPTHAQAWVNAQTGMLYQSSRPNTPPPSAQGTGEWVAVNCGDHGSPGVCWQWEALSTLSLSGIPIGQ